MTDLIAYVFDDLILSDCSLEQKSQIVGLMSEIRIDGERKHERDKEQITDEWFDSIAGWINGPEPEDEGEHGRCL